MEQVILPKSNRKLYYQIFKGINFSDLVIFSCFLLTAILVAYLVPTTICKWILTTIVLLLGALSLVKNSNETRVYHTTFNAIKYCAKSLVNRKVIIKPHYVNTTSNSVMGFKYKKEKLFVAGIQLQATNLQLLNEWQQQVTIEDFANLLQVINLPCKLIKIDNHYDFQNQINNLQKQLKQANKINKAFISLQIKQLQALSNTNQMI